MARPSLNEVEAEAVWEAMAAMGMAEAVGGGRRRQWRSRGEGWDGRHRVHWYCRERRVVGCVGQLERGG